MTVKRGVNLWQWLFNLVWHKKRHAEQILRSDSITHRGRSKTMHVSPSGPLTIIQALPILLNIWFLNWNNLCTFVFNNYLGAKYGRINLVITFLSTCHFTSFLNLHVKNNFSLPKSGTNLKIYSKLTFFPKLISFDNTTSNWVH